MNKNNNKPCSENIECNELWCYYVATLNIHQHELASVCLWDTNDQPHYTYDINNVEWQH